MVVKHIQRKLQDKSEKHTEALRKLGLLAAKVELPANVHIMPTTPQFVGMNTVLQDPATEHVDFVRLASILIEKSVPLPSCATNPDC
jgi:uridine kinase